MLWASPDQYETLEPTVGSSSSDVSSIVFLPATPVFLSLIAYGLGDRLTLSL